MNPNKEKHLLFITRANKCTHTHTHKHEVNMKILNYITRAPTYFAASIPSSGSFDIAFAKVI